MGCLGPEKDQDENESCGGRVWGQGRGGSSSEGELVEDVSEGDGEEEVTMVVKGRGWERVWRWWWVESDSEGSGERGWEFKIQIQIPTIFFMLIDLMTNFIFYQDKFVN